MVGLDANTWHLEPTSLSGISVEVLSALFRLTFLKLICAPSDRDDLRDPQTPSYLLQTLLPTEML